MAIAHYSYANDKDDHLDRVAIITLLCVAPLWFVYFLTLMIFRLRHAGKICSGDYVSERLLTHNYLEPYIHNNGLFLWSAIVG